MLCVIRQSSVILRVGAPISHITLLCVIRQNVIILGVVAHNVHVKGVGNNGINIFLSK
jgi:hypothetical protein